MIMDLYKTFLLPKSWVRSQSASGSIQTGDGRVLSTGSVQTHEGQLFIAEEAGRLFVDLADIVEQLHSKEEFRSVHPISDRLRRCQQIPAESYRASQTGQRTGCEGI